MEKPSTSPMSPAGRYMLGRMEYAPNLSRKAFEDLTVTRQVEPQRTAYAYPRSYSAMGNTLTQITQGLPRLELLVRDAERHTGCTTVVVRGSSGFAPAVLLASRMPDITFVMAEKPGVRHHGCSLTPIFRDMGNRFSEYLIMDDFTSSGETVEGIRRDVDAKLRGLILYASAGSSAACGWVGGPVFANNCFY